MSSVPSGSGSGALLGIDLGTSSVKAVLTSSAGEVVATGTAEHPVLAPHPGWAESDPAQWWTAVVTAVRAAVAGAGATSRSIEGIGLSGQMHGVVLADATGRPVRPAVLHPDTRAAAQLADYRALPSAVRARLGNPLSPNMAGPVLLWLAASEPRALDAAAWALQPKDWLRWRLVGQVASEPSDASATLLYDLAGDRWDADLVAALGMRGDLLPPLLPHAGSPAGELTASAAQELGLRPGTPVAAGGADTAVAAVGSGLVGVAGVQLTVGTGGQIITLRDTRRPRPPGHSPVPHRRAERVYAMGAVLNAGLALGWVCRTTGASWSELYASAGSAAADDPVFLPHLTGERTPHLDPALRGAWTGLALHHERDALLRAALEGVAFALRDALDALAVPAGVPLRLAGGGSTAPGWRQLLADVLEHPLVAVPVPAASGRGAALLGGVAAGVVDPAGLGTALAPRPGATTAPTRAGVALHGERRAAFTTALSALRP